MKYFIYLLINLFLINLIFKMRFEICNACNLIDLPVKKKIHKHSALIFGGIFLIFGYISNFIYIYIFEQDYYNYLSPFFIISLFILSFFDDIKNLNAILKLFLIFLLSFLSIIFDSDLKILTLNSYLINEKIFFPNLFLNYLLTIISIALFINAFNFSDGIDGLASLLGISFFLYIFLKNPILFEVFFIFFLYLFLFLIINLKYKIFLGDSGNYLISVSLATILLKENYNNYNLYFAEEIYLLFLIPGLDMLRLFFKRIYHQRSPFSKDLDHLHHKLMRRYNHTYSIVIYLTIVNLPIFLFNYFNDFLIIIIFFTKITYFILINKLSANK